MRHNPHEKLMNCRHVNTSRHNLRSVARYILTFYTATEISRETTYIHTTKMNCFKLKIIGLKKANIIVYKTSILTMSVPLDCIAETTTDRYKKKAKLQN